MEGFIIAGKAFCVCEDLRQLAKQHKGMTVDEVLKQRKQEEIKKTIDNQIDEIINQSKKKGY
jgi:methylphosphotriester-DNA--protein-cysteine methyltransferase